MPPSPQPAPKKDPWAAFRHRDFTLLQFARALNIVSFQMMGLAIAQDIYTHTKSAMNLGLIGLVQFLPSIAFALFTGHAADRYPRRSIIQLCQMLMVISMALLVVLTWNGIHRVWPIYAILFLVGTARAFQAPATQALMPRLVPKEIFSNAVMWNGSVFNLFTIVGPGAGGVVYWLAHGSLPVYISAGIMMASAIYLMSRVNNVRSARAEKNYDWQTLVAGIKFVFNRPVVLGAISLDLFAVLLGGAVALLPIYANDILTIRDEPVGSMGLGSLRASFALGAVVMGFMLAHLPPMRQAGKAMFWSVAGFGLFTVFFGVSTNYWVSLACLFTLGALDMISVVVRHTMVQLATPDEMRGRVSAVNMIFIGASNELGEFESGATAAWWGPVWAVVIGGLGTLAVTALWAWWFPELRRFKKLDQSTVTPTAKAQVVEQAKAVEDENENKLAV